MGSVMDNDPFYTFSGDERAALLLLCDRIKHDIGRYVTLQQRWLASDATDDERVEAIIADVLHTRRDELGSTDVVALWRGHAPALLGKIALSARPVDLSADHDVASLEALMARLQQVIDAVRAGQLFDARQASAICGQVAQHVNALSRRARAAARRE